MSEVLEGFDSVGGSWTRVRTLQGLLHTYVNPNISAASTDVSGSMTDVGDWRMSLETENTPIRTSAVGDTVLDCEPLSTHLILWRLHFDFKLASLSKRTTKV